MSEVLDGLRVLVTRPAHQSKTLCQLLEQHGASVFSFPVIEIVEPEDTKTPRAILSQLESFDFAIFISANSVIRTLEWWGNQPPPPTLAIAAVGQGTARTLTRLGWPVHIAPKERFDSEALLALPDFCELTGKKVVIFRGVGGREVLAQTLVQRGAVVTYAEVYRRAKPSIKNTLLLDWVQVDRPTVTLLTSNESLQNLVDLLGPKGRSWLLSTDLVVFSERTAAFAKKSNLRGKVHVVRQASDQGILETLVSLCSKNNA